MTKHVITLSVDELARRLGVERERVEFEIIEGGRVGDQVLAGFLCHVDGKDLTDCQEKIFEEFLKECGGVEAVAIVPTADRIDEKLGG